MVSGSRAGKPVAAVHPQLRRRTDLRFSAPDDLALIAAAHENDPSAGRLMVAPATGGAPRDLRPDWEGDVKTLAFIGKKTVAYVAHENLETMLVRQDIDGGKPKVVGFLVKKELDYLGDALESPTRRASRTVLDILYDCLTAWLAPANSVLATPITGTDCCSAS